MLERVLTIAHWPFLPSASAAAAAEALTESGRPARSASLSMKSG